MYSPQGFHHSKKPPGYFRITTLEIQNHSPTNSDHSSHAMQKKMEDRALASYSCNPGKSQVMALSHPGGTNQHTHPIRWTNGTALIKDNVAATIQYHRRFRILSYPHPINPRNHTSLPALGHPSLPRPSRPSLFPESNPYPKTC